MKAKAFTYMKSVVAVSALVLASTTMVTAVQANNEFYQVTDVANDDALNMRSGPGTANPVISSIPPNGRTILTTGNSQQVGNSTWTEVVWLGQIGWVNDRYLGAAVDQQMAPAPAPVAPVINRKPVQVNVNYNADEHTHPANRCTRTINHTHRNGSGAHSHNYSCQRGAPRTQSRDRMQADRARPQTRSNVNTHTHPRNRCTNSITHVHPNGVRTHNHHYSCKPGQTMARPKFNQPKYIRYNN